MRRQFLLALFVTGALLLIGCYKSESTTNNNPTTSTNKAETAAPAASTAPATTAAAEKIGVAECDDFIAKYDACVSSKVPEMARAQYKTGIEQWRKSWHTLAANPQTRATLAKVCKDTVAQAQQSMKAYGCKF